MDWMSMSDEQRSRAQKDPRPSGSAFHAVTVHRPWPYAASSKSHARKAAMPGRVSASGWQSR
jgi:hypothetical protein